VQVIRVFDFEAYPFRSIGVLEIGLIKGLLSTQGDFSRPL